MSTWPNRGAPPARPGRGLRNDIKPQPVHLSQAGSCSNEWSQLYCRHVEIYAWTSTAARGSSYSPAQKPVAHSGEDGAGGPR